MTKVLSREVLASMQFYNTLSNSIKQFQLTGLLLLAAFLDGVPPINNEIAKTAEGLSNQSLNHSLGGNSSNIAQAKSGEFYKLVYLLPSQIHISGVEISVCIPGTSTFFFS